MTLPGADPPYRWNNRPSYRKYYLPNQKTTAGGFVYESNRNHPPHRRFGPGGHPQGDQTDHANQGGRPLVDNIDTYGKGGFLLRDVGKEDKHDIEHQTRTAVLLLKSNILATFHPV